MLNKTKHNWLLTFGLLFFSASLFGQSSSKPLITEMQVTNGDSTYRYIYLYNVEGLKTLETKYVSKNGEWNRRQQTEWIYANNLCTNQYIRNWSNYNWELVHQIDFTYNNNLLTSETHFTFGSGTYTPEKKHSRTYNNDKITTETDSTWNNSNWLVSSKTDYKYNVSTSNLDTLYFTKFKNGVQDSKSRIDFSYNSSSLLSKQTYSELIDSNWVNSFQTTTYYEPSSTRKNYQTKKVWNIGTKKWEYSQNISYEYNTSGNLISENYQRWNSQFWENDLRYGYSYDANNELLKKTNYLPIYDDFRPASSINYSEFENGKASLIEANYEFWGGETGILTNTFIPFKFNDESMIQYGSKIKISYIPVSDTGVITLDGSTKKGSIDVYPNPSNGIFYFDTQKYDVENWVVCDISGKAILSKTIQEKSGVIDLTDFQNGVYILRVKTQQGILSQKLIKK